MSPKMLVEFDMWWQGPNWLPLEPAQWPLQPTEVDEQELPEIRKNLLPTFLPPPELGDRADRYTKWIRVMSWIWKFISYASKRATRPTERELTLQDLTTGKTKALLATQIQHLGEEYEIVRQGKALP